MGAFENAFDNLNSQQLKAVQQIDGPLLVIAGPGTGKTQLLALRVANILKSNPTVLPSNILCLTFTDAASDNLRQRLINFIGQDAYRVGVYTFHSFGAHIMSIYPEYFFTWRETKTADSLTTHRILEDVLSKLPGNSDLARRGIEGDFYAIRQLKNLIGDAKKANLSPGELRLIINDNYRVCEQLLPKIRRYWPSKLTPGSLEQINQLVEFMASQKADKEVVAGVAPLKNMLALSLGEAAKQSQELEARARTKPFTAWKDQWLAKTQDGWVFKLQNYGQKLLEAADIYELYQQQLGQKSLADFSDQISWTLNALRDNQELRLNLREQYLYVMIDEFQDTNRAQLQMAGYLSRDESEAGEPNIMAVGDDDQAIYRFQGADIANIGEFESAYPGHKIINLDTNYRSNADIIANAQKINSQIIHSLAKLKKFDKKLTPTERKRGAGVILNEFKYDSQHYAWTAQKIKTLAGKDADIAVLARERAQLDALVPYLRHLNIPINYERRENVLDQEHIATLLNMGRLVDLISSGRLEQANALLPEILSEPMWQISPRSIWELSSQSYKSKLLWLDEIYRQKDKKLMSVADFFVGLASQAKKLPMEQMLDRLIGANSEPGDDDTDFGSGEPDAQKIISPFKNYFFNEQLRADNPAQYLTFLSHLNTLRRHLRSYQTGQGRALTLSDLIEFCDSYRRAELSMVDNAPHHETPGAVQLMTVHGSKGLEFENVFVIGLQHSVWTKSGGTNRFSYPPNLQEIKPSDNQDDDGLRLLFVAMTRAKQSLYLNYFKLDESDKHHQPYAPLLALELEPDQPPANAEPSVLAKQYEERWLTTHRSIDKSDMRAMLAEKLSRYQLSATHLNNFTDVTSGGPLYFFTQNLLNFPSSLTPSSIYGSLIHSALAEAHRLVIAGKTVEPQKLINKFKEQITVQALADTDKARLARDGTACLERFFEARLGLFNDLQEAEFDFKNQGVVVGEARLKGFIDLIDSDKSAKNVWVSDYKTGSPLTGWQQPPSAKEHARIKAHRYRQQLLFYKLLIDGSNQFGQKGYKAQSGKLVFVQPDNSGKIRKLELEYENEDVQRMKKLVQAVWQKIQNLDLADTSEYPKTEQGIRQFEDDLISGLTGY